MYPLGPETALGEITPAFSASVYLALVRRPFPPIKPDLERKTGFLESFRKGELIRANLALGSQVSIPLRGLAANRAGDETLSAFGLRDSGGWLAAAARTACPDKRSAVLCPFPLFNIWRFPNSYAQGASLCFPQDPFFRSQSRQAPTCFGVRRDSDQNRKLFPASGKTLDDPGRSYFSESRSGHRSVSHF